MIKVEGEFILGLPRRITRVISEGIEDFAAAQNREFPGKQCVGKKYRRSYWIVSTATDLGNGRIFRCVRIRCLKDRDEQQEVYKACLVPSICLVERGRGGEAETRELLEESQIQNNIRYLYLGQRSEEGIYYPGKLRIIRNNLRGRLKETWRYVMGIAVPERFLGV